MKIIAWNVNGLRSLLKTQYLDELLNEEMPDILCIGETKLSCKKPNDMLIITQSLNEKAPQLKYIIWSTCKIKGGYSGTAILSKKEPLNIIHGLKYNDNEIDEEGRVITIELINYYLIHVYTPNSGQHLKRLNWRTQIWDRAFEYYIIELQKTKPVIICGDLNVAHASIDLANPKTNLKTAGYTIEERESFNNILTNCDLIDTFRNKYINKIEYSYWSYMRKSREKNIGWRIDYFLVSNILNKKVKESCILTHILGSDHAPIKIII
jgi:exodeoxyribonuclease-3